MSKSALNFFEERLQNHLVVDCNGALFVNQNGEKLSSKRRMPRKSIGLTN